MSTELKKSIILWLQFSDGMLKKITLDLRPKCVVRTNNSIVMHGEPWFYNLFSSKRHD